MQIMLCFLEIIITASHTSVFDYCNMWIAFDMFINKYIKINKFIVLNIKYL